MAKKSLQNQTGTKNSFKPTQIRKNEIKKKKNMKLGNKAILFLFF